MSYSVKLRIFSYPPVLTFVLGAQKNFLTEMLLLSTNNISVVDNKPVFSYTLRLISTGLHALIIHTLQIIIPPANFVCRGYTVFTLSVRACVRPSVRL